MAWPGSNPQHRFGANRRGVRKPEYDGYKWDSQEELMRYTYLKSLERVGAIRDLRVKLPWSVTINGVKIWRARIRFDFAWVENGDGRIVETAIGGWRVDGDGDLVVEDWKGRVDTKGPDWGLFVAKARVVYALHGVRVGIMTRNGRPVEITFD